MRPWGSEATPYLNDLARPIYLLLNFNYRPPSDFTDDECCEQILDRGSFHLTAEIRCCVAFLFHSVFPPTRKSLSYGWIHTLLSVPQRASYNWQTQRWISTKNCISSFRLFVTRNRNTHATSLVSCVYAVYPKYSKSHFDMSSIVAWDLGKCLLLFRFWGTMPWS